MDKQIRQRSEAEQNQMEPNWAPRNKLSCVESNCAPWSRTKPSSVNATEQNPVLELECDILPLKRFVWNVEKICLLKINADLIKTN